MSKIQKSPAKGKQNTLDICSITIGPNVSTGIRGMTESFAGKIFVLESGGVPMGIFKSQSQIFNRSVIRLVVRAKGGLEVGSPKKRKVMDT